MALRVDTTAEREPADVAALRLVLLGGFRIEHDGVSLPENAWKRPQARTLVKLLATEQTHRLHREQITEIFWPDQPPDAAAGNLRRLLYLVRRSLPVEVVVLRDEVVALDTARVWIDADAFERTARAALAGGSVVEAEAALTLYGGELLPEDRYAEWAESRRETLEALRRTLLLSLARTLARQGEPESAIERLRQLLAIDPADEAAHRALMRLHVAAGNRQEALRQYQRCREALAEHVGVDPDAETEALRHQVETGAAVSTTPVLPPAAARRWRTPLIGRERALDLVLVPPIPGATDRRHASPTEQVGVVLVRGEAGVGKTRLAAEAAREAGRRGCLILWGTCSAQAVYGPFAEALEQYAGGLGAAERTELARAHPEIARILPSLDPVYGSAPEHGAGDDLRLFADVARFLTHLAAIRPVLLVLDDLQLADSATLALLAYLARLPAARRNWLILATYRIEEAQAGSALTATLEELQRSVRSRQVDLLRLGRRECIRLVESVLNGPVDEAAGEHVFRTSLGNPLFAVELLGALKASGDLVRTEAEWRRAGSEAGMPIPSQVADLIASRLRALDEETRRFVSLAAVAGMSTSFAVLRKSAELTGAQTEELLNALERAVEARVLEEMAASGSIPPGFRFQHPLFREVGYALLGPSRRAYLHGIVVQAIESVQPGDLAALAHHAVRSTNRDASVLYLERAGDHARAAYANALAEAHYRELLGLLSPLEDATHRARVQLKLGTVLNVLGRYGEAVVVLEDAAGGLAAAGDPDGLGRAVVAISRAHAMQGTAGEVLDRLQQTIEELEGRADPLVLAALLDTLTGILLTLGRYVELSPVIERGAAYARQQAAEPEGRWHLANAEFRRAMAAATLGRRDGANSILEAAMPLIESTGDPDLLMLALNLLANGAIAAGDLAGSCRYYERALAAAERMGSPAWIGRLRCFLGRSLFMRGEWAEGLCIAEEGYAQLASLGTPLYLAYGGFTLGMMYLGAGRWQEARRLLESVPDIAGADMQATRMAAAFAAELDVIEGKPQRARERLEPLISPMSTETGTPWVSAALAWTYAVLDDGDRALELAEQAVCQASAATQVGRVEALRAQGAVLIELRQWQAAERSLAEAFALAREIHYVWRQPFIVLLQARLHERQGNHDRALSLLQQGRELLRELGGEQAAGRTELYAGVPQPARME